MAPLSLLYVAEIISGLKYKAVHLTSNFGQLITRSNLQDTQIEALQAGEADAVARLTAVEGDVTTAEAAITALQAALQGAGYKATSSPYVVDIDQYSTITIDDSIVSPVIRLPYVGDRDPGLEVVVHANPENSTKWTLEVITDMAGETPVITTYELTAGAIVTARIMIGRSSSVRTWGIIVDHDLIVSSYNLIQGARSLDWSDIDTGTLVIECAASNFTVTLPPISQIGSRLLPVVLRTTSSGNIFVKSHADDGDETIATLTTSSSSAYHLLASNTYTNRWNKVTLS